MRITRVGSPKRLTARAVVAAAIPLATGCAGSVVVPDVAPAIEGTVVSLTGANGPQDDGVMHVKTVPVEVDPCGILFRVDRGTDVLVRSGGVTRRGDGRDLGVGRRVRVWAFGGVAESCPGQAGADVIEIEPAS